MSDRERVTITSGMDPNDGCPLNLLAFKIHKNAVNHGWWESHRTFPEVIALIHSELSEALEEYRKGHNPTKVYYNPEDPNKPEGIPIELADAIIRILDYCNFSQIDIERAILLKHKYNITRPYRHGGKKC